MDLDIKNKNFVVTGVTSGFGRSVAVQLMEQGATVYGVARRGELLSELKYTYDSRFEYLETDITKKGAVDKLNDLIGVTEISGVFVNAGGPPAKSFIETELSDWDEAYQKLLRWKVDLVKKLLPNFLENK